MAFKIKTLNFVSFEPYLCIFQFYPFIFYIYINQLI